MSVVEATKVHQMCVNGGRNGEHYNLDNSRWCHLYATCAQKSLVNPPLQEKKQL